MKIVGDSVSFSVADVVFGTMWWLAALLAYVAAFYVPLCLLGLLVVPVAALATETVPSPYYAGRQVLAFSWRVAQALYGNWENGVDGMAGYIAPSWAATATGKSKWAQIFLWSALRNKIDNTRFWPVISPLFRPADIRWLCSDSWPTEGTAYTPPAGTAGWGVAWQGMVASVMLQWVKPIFGKTQLWLGWNLRPGDSNPNRIGNRLPRTAVTIELG